MNKKCPKCKENSLQKWGKKYGKQNYKCTKCKYSFVNKSRKTEEKKEKIYTENILNNDKH